MNDTYGGNDDLDYDPETNTYCVEYDPGDGRPSVALVAAVATITGLEERDLQRLYETISPESLDDLFSPTEQGRLRGDGRVEFTYQDFQVTVYSYGSIEIRPPGRRNEDGPG